MSNNTLEFIVRMKDLMSGGLSKIAQTGKSTFAQIGGYIKNTLGLNKNLSASLDKLNHDLSLARLKRNAATVKFEFAAATKEVNKLERAISQLEGRGSRSSGSGFGSGLLRSLAPVAITGMLTAMLTTGANASIRAATDFEATNKTYEVLTGSKKVGKDLAGQLNALQQNTILGPEVFKSGQTLLGFGLAVDKVLPTIKMLGDIAMGDAERFNALTLAFAQMTAAGRLQGQDLLQFVNAGFNPLLVISKQTGKSMLELRKEMEKGAISSQMVTKAFETATTKGGQFNDMMNQMAETTKGKMAMIEGQTQANMIAIGKTLAPWKLAWEEYKLGVLGLITPHQRLQDSIISEKAGVNSLIAAITNVNTANNVRLELLKKLKNTYPELYGAIDIENIKNKDLLDTLTSVNAQYEKRITLAARQNSVNELQAQSDKLFKNLVYNTQAVESGGGWNFYDELVNGTRIGTESLKVWDRAYKSSLDKLHMATDALEVEKNMQRIQKVMDFAKDPGDMQVFKGRDKDMKEFIDLKNKWEFSGGLRSGLNLKDLERAEQLLGLSSKVTASGITGAGGNSSATSDKKDSVAASITSGGPRVININGVKFTDKIEIHAASTKEGIDDMEQRLQEMFLRILNSGASVQ